MTTLETLLQTDARLSARLRLPQQGGPVWRAAVFFAHSGDSWFWLAGLALVALLTRGAWRTLAVVMALGVLGLAVFVLAVKFSVRRQRPEGEWGAVYRSRDPHSFPSGHAARAALLAVLAWGLGPLWLAVLLTLWAPLVGLARVATGVHYLSDVVVGLLIGLLAGWGLLALAPWVLAWVGLGV